ncbi:MAG: hypothetical protein MJ138_04105 [Kiritimatiellae bacterium]|nr:hypothetical protein [Kiritimatiellia bacterium]
MNAEELLKTWPSWAKANAETMLASPAWRMTVDYDGRRGTLAAAPEGCPVETLDLGVAFEDEECVLGIGDSPSFADLHALWAKREALDRNVLLAVVEKECGSLFQALEDATRKQFSVKGFVSASAPSAGRRRFRLSVDSVQIDFALDLTPALTLNWGKLEFLDPAHESIRSLERPAWADYVSLMVSADELAALKPGDFLLLPETMPAPRWCVEPADDDAVHVVGVGRTQVSFAQLADGNLPEVPPLGQAALVKNGREIGRVTPSAAGCAKALKVENPALNG